MDEKLKTLHDRIDRDFTYQPPTKEGIVDMIIIRDLCKNLGHNIVDHVPPGREQSLALTALEQVSMYSNAGIAREGAVVLVSSVYACPRCGAESSTDHGNRDGSYGPGLHLFECDACHVGFPVEMS